MALHAKTFQTRALTAIVFAVVMLAGLFLGPLSFFLLFSVIHFGCWWEFFQLIEKIYGTRFHIYIKLGLICIGYGLMLWLSGDDFGFNGYSLRDNFSLPVSAAGFAVVFVGIFQKMAVSIKVFFAALLGLLYISLSWGLMLDLYAVNITIQSEGQGDVIYRAIEIFPLIVVFTIWINDTMAYIVGSFIGKTPLSKISPKKTWEGTIGGMVLAIGVVAALIIFVFDFAEAMSWYHWLIIPAIAAIAGTIGDLLESKLKRMAGVKDSGTLMPGHGGFLDRFDSMLLAVPFVWLYLQFI